MILLKKLKGHSQLYVNGKLLNLEKAPGRQVVCFIPHKGGRKMKRNEIKCLLLRIKSLSSRGASRTPDFMGNCPIICHMC